MAHVPDVLGEGGEGPAHVEEGERQGDHVHLLHGVGARARDISLNTRHTISQSCGCGSGFNGVPGSESGSRRAKITHKHKKSFKNCWMFSFEG